VLVVIVEVLVVLVEVLVVLGEVLVVLVEILVVLVEILVVDDVVELVVVIAIKKLQNNIKNYLNFSKSI